MILFFPSLPSVFAKPPSFNQILAHTGWLSQRGAPATQFTCNHLPNRRGYLTVHLFTQKPVIVMQAGTHAHTHTCRISRYLTQRLNAFSRRSKKIPQFFSKFNSIIYPQNFHIYSQMPTGSLKLTFSLGR